jgi:hypothetical protein
MTTIEQGSFVYSTTITSGKIPNSKVYKFGYRKEQQPNVEAKHYTLGEDGHYNEADVLEFNNVKQYCDNLENTISVPPMTIFNPDTLVDLLCVNGLPIKGEEVFSFIDPERESEIRRLKEENKNLRRLAGISTGFK